MLGEKNTDNVPIFAVSRELLLSQCLVGVGIVSYKILCVLCNVQHDNRSEEIFKIMIPAI